MNCEEAEKKLFESFDTSCLEKNEKIKWTERIPNEEVLCRVEEKRTIFDAVMKRKMNCFAES